MGDVGVGSGVDCCVGVGVIGGGVEPLSVGEAVGVVVSVTVSPGRRVAAGVSVRVRRSVVVVVAVMSNAAASKTPAPSPPSSRPGEDTADDSRFPPHSCWLGVCSI